MEVLEKQQATAWFTLPSAPSSMLEVPVDDVKVIAFTAGYRLELDIAFPISLWDVGSPYIGWDETDPTAVIERVKKLHD